MNKKISSDLLGQPRQIASNVLGKRFVWTPFSIFSTMSRDWQIRKRQWLSLGIRSEVGRGEGLLKFSDTVAYYQDKDGRKMVKRPPGFDPNGYNATAGRGGTTAAPPGSIWLGSKGKPVGGSAAINGNGLGDDVEQAATSIFDPVICEIMYKWFTPKNGLIIDPFAGGSVRGIVASCLGYDYIGVDLRPEQIKSNEDQANEICPNNPPFWFEGDSRNIDQILEGVEADAVFSCPPYFDLELYSGDDRDLSNCTWDEFCNSYCEIIVRTCSLLKNDRFACFVVGDVRDKQGNLRALSALTVNCFEKAGLKLYNEIIMATAIGSLHLRVNRQFNNSRKIGRAHQSVLVFVKGDPKKAIDALPPFDSVV
jgi:hypothetical protein